MRFVERAGDNGDRQCVGERERAFLEAMGERLAVNQFQDEERGALVLADVVERADVRMRELRDRARFTVEALTELRIGGERVVEDLDSDGAIEAGVACLVDLAHAARAQQ